MAWLLLVCCYWFGRGSLPPLKIVFYFLSFRIFQGFEIQISATQGSATTHSLLFHILLFFQPCPHLYERGIYLHKKNKVDDVESGEEEDLLARFSEKFDTEAVSTY